MSDVPVGDADGGAPPVRARRWPRRARRSATVIVVVLGGYYLVTLFQVWSTGRSDQARPVDAIVVLGAAQYDGRPSTQLAARLDHTVELYRQGLAPVVVVTGGKRSGDRFTEAQASATYLLDRGVPESAILREDTGRTTYESLRNVAGVLRAEGLRRVLLVSDPFHVLRARLSAEEVGLVAYTSPTRTSPVRGWSAARKELKEAAGIALGRVIGFSRLPT